MLILGGTGDRGGGREGDGEKEKERGREADNVLIGISFLSSSIAKFSVLKAEL